MGSEQDNFWKGSFGDDYHDRQFSVGSVLDNEALFRVLLPIDISSVMEFGAGEGRNIAAIHNIFPDIDLWSVEINGLAASKIAYGNVIIGAALDVDITWHCDLVLTKGFLIHVPPNDLEKVYERLYKTANKYILICEYYNPTPVEVEYRGHSGQLWKRDFAEELLEKYDDLELVGYKFIYHRDPYPQDDITCFLLRKNK